MSKSGKVTNVRPGSDHKLKIQGSGPEQEAALQIAKILSVVLEDNKFDLDVENLSKKTCLSRTRILQLLSDPRFKRIMDKQLELKASSLMGKSLAAIETVLDDPDEGSQRKLQASTANATVYRALASGRDKHEESQGEVDIAQLMRKLESKNKLKRIHVEVTDRGDV